MSKITTIALIIIAMSLGVMAALYMARKKYNKMANINCTLPAGLETYFTKDANNGFSGDFANGNHSIKETRAAEDEWLQAARLHDFNLRNEHHHLLASLGSDSGYLGGTNLNDNTPIENKLSSSVETANVCNKDVINDEGEQVSLPCSTASVDSVVDSSAECESNNLVLEHPALTLFPNSNGYIKQSMLQPWQFVNSTDGANNQLANGNNETNGYIAVQNFTKALEKPKQPNDLMACTGGYVMQQDLQHFFNQNSITNPPALTVPNANSRSDNLQEFSNNGYCTLDNLSKLNITNTNQQQQQQPNELSHNNSPPITANHSNPANSNISKPGIISGYVTQQDLNLFAQHQQNY